MNAPMTAPTQAALRLEWLEKANLLIEALPFMRRYSGQTMVIKYGGHAMGDAAAARNFARDIVLLKQVGINPIIVHGGGPQIGSMLKRLAIKSEFIEGLRVTDEATVEVVEMVLAGKINKEIVALIQQEGGKAIGISGKDANLITARKLAMTRRDPTSFIEQAVDLGYVGEPDSIDPKLLSSLIATEFIPVIAPIGLGADGQTYNINADTAAGAIAGALKAKRFLLLTDVEGVLDQDKQLIRQLTIAQASELQARGVISGGMIPKIETCLTALQAGAEGVVILDGRVAHAMLLELFTTLGSGTMIIKG